MLFNLLIFNYDAHGKNISFFVGNNGFALTPFYDLVNIKMYPDFAHEMAMGLGDEFDGDTVKAYQLADFADSCQLSRPLLAKRLKYLINKLILGLDNEISQLLTNDDENRYLMLYKSIVNERCMHLLNQADDIVSMEL